MWTGSSHWRGGGGGVRKPETGIIYIVYLILITDSPIVYRKISLFSSHCLIFALLTMMPLKRICATSMIFNLLLTSTPSQMDSAVHSEALLGTLGIRRLRKQQGLHCKNSPLLTRCRWDGKKGIKHCKPYRTWVEISMPGI